MLPEQVSIEAYCTRARQLSLRRLPFLASRSQEWWLEQSPFFGEQRQRIWIFWRRILHTCHHRTQLTVYLRLLEKPVPSIYGPTADVVWVGADPTTTVEAANRLAFLNTGLQQRLATVF
ncbi:MAG: DinB family protein [Bryobacteraceae bacterium]